MKKRAAFTMIELIFVIIILGILATVALPKFAGTSEQAYIASGRSDVASIRTAIETERQKRFMKGETGYISKLDNLNDTTDINATDVKLFDTNGSSKLLAYGIVTKNGDGGWLKTAAYTAPLSKYTYKVGGLLITFTYNSDDGTFDCDPTAGTTTQQNYCKKLSQ